MKKILKELSEEKSKADIKLTFDHHENTYEGMNAKLFMETESDKMGYSGVIKYIDSRLEDAYRRFDCNSDVLVTLTITTQKQTPVKLTAHKPYIQFKIFTSD